MKMERKTKGQLLYEHEHPSMIPVTHWDGRQFAREPFYVPNPRDPAPWRFLTKTCQDGYESRAVGHHLFSEAVETV